MGSYVLYITNFRSWLNFQTMAIATTVNFPAFKARVVRSASRLIRSGAIPIQVNKGKALSIGFAIDIQMMSKSVIGSMKFGRPEGLRVLILDGNKVVAILDYLYRSKKLKFSHALVGDQVAEFVDALNSIEKKFRSQAIPCQVTYLHFLLSPHDYLQVKSKKELSYFKWSDGKLSKTSQESIQTELKMIIKTRQPVSNNP